MSVKLIIVALLAATHVMANSDTKTVTTTFCSGATTGTCDCQDAKVVNYTVGKCEEKAGKHWKVDDCDASDKDAAIVIKGYDGDTCEPNTMHVSTQCKGSRQHVARCEAAQGGAATVKLYLDCSSRECGDRDCPALTFTDATCQKAGEKYYKLVTDIASGCPEPAQGGARRAAAAAATDEKTIDFRIYDDEDTCSKDGEKNKGTEYKVPQECAFTQYHKATCATNEAKTFIQTCRDSGCTGSTCTKTEFTPGVPVLMNGQYLVVDTCSDSSGLSLKTYLGWKTYKKKCAAAAGGSGREMATCTTDDSNGSGNGTNDTTTGTNDTTTAGNGTNDTTTTPESSGAGNGAFSAGVLALVLCVLACVY